VWRLIRSKPSLRERTAERALADFRTTLLPPAPPPEAPDLFGEHLERFDSPHALSIGTLGDGRTVKLPRDIACKHAAIGGASGKGKTRLLALLIFQLLSGLFDGSAPETEVECIDGKGETSDFIKAWLEVLRRTGPEPVRTWIEENVWVLGWLHDAVTPMPLFDTTDATMSLAYLADLRTETTVDASAYSFTDGTRHEFAMYARLCATLGHPLNVNVLSAIYTDQGLRERLLRDVADPQLRDHYGNIEDYVPKGTFHALRRRVEHLNSHRVIRASIGLPSAAIPTLGIRRTGRLRIVDVSTRFELPLAVAAERQRHRIIDVLRSAPRRDRRTPAVLIVEEAARLLATSPDLADELAGGVQTLRYFNVGVWMAAQDFSILPAAILEPVLLNSFWLAMFQTRRDAAIFAKQVGGDADDAKAEAKVRRDFERDIENLPKQTCYVWPRDHRVFRLRVMDCPDPAADGLTIEQLAAEFDRGVSAKSMISIDRADQIIAQWEASVLSRREIPPPPQAEETPRRRTFSMEDLLHAGREEDGADD